MNSAYEKNYDTVAPGCLCEDKEDQFFCASWEGKDCYNLYLDEADKNMKNFGCGCDHHLSLRRDDCHHDCRCFEHEG